MLQIINSFIRKMIIGAYAVILTAGIAALHVNATTVKDDSTVDFVLVIDCSGSMNRNDEEGWTAEATRNFVDFLGTENVRLGIVAMGEDYGEKAYPVGVNDPESKNRVTVALPLQSITEDDEKEKAQTIITEITKKKEGGKETMTPIGYSLQAACEILEEGKAADGKAAIILLSDGQVEGQTDYVDRKTKQDYQSIDASCDIAADHDWPVYCMELNYRKQNRKGDGLPGIAYHQMRENIPSRTGTEPHEVISAKDATSTLEAIYNTFFNIQSVDGKVRVSEDTQEPFTVEEMTAEQTVVLHGDVSKLKTVGFKSPSGNIETYRVSDGDKLEKLRKIKYDNNSIVMKMIMPEEGKWTLLLSGSGDVELDYSSISLREMNLVLSSSQKDGDISASKGKAIDFSATFEYSGIKYESTDFYKKYPAKLHINDETVNMKSTEDGYTCSYEFKKTGSFEVFAQVDSSFFKEGSRRSGTFTYHVDNLPTVAKGTIPEFSCGIGESTEQIDLRDFFDSQDGDPLAFSIEKANRDDYEYELSEDGILRLKANDTSRAFDVTAIARDDSGEKGASQNFVFRVLNKPIEVIGDTEEQIHLVIGSGRSSYYSRDKKNEEDSDEIILEWSSFFTDPDGAKPDVRIHVDENEDVVSFEQDDNSVALTALKEGNAKFTIVAIDGNADETAQYILLDVTVDSAVAAAVKNARVFIILIAVAALIVVAVLVTLFGGRKVYGTWNITLNGEKREEIVISSYRHGKGRTVNISQLLADLDLPGAFPKIQLCGGDKFKKVVYLRSAGTVDNVEMNYDPMDDFKDRKRIDIGKGDIITLSLDDNRLTLERLWE